MDFSEAIKTQYEKQSQRLKLLSDLKLNFKTINLDCSLKKQLLEVIFDVTPNLPVVYFFEVVEKDNDLVWNALNAFKNLKTRSCPRITKVGLNNKSSILYVGSVKWQFANRVKQHLGFGHPHTFALQLTHWAADINLKVKLNYCELSEDNRIIIRDVEAALSRFLNPLVGKREE